MLPEKPGAEVFSVGTPWTVVSEMEAGSMLSRAWMEEQRPTMRIPARDL